MARRKRELLSVHRDYILKIAEKLFEKKGVSKTTMDDIAKASEYSKATLYVYFKNKEEIVQCITLNSMSVLKDCIVQSLEGTAEYYSRYEGMCQAFTDYHHQYPIYFQMLIGEINVDLDNEATPQVFRDIFEVGEVINSHIAKFLQEGVECKELKENLDLTQAVFFLWSSLVGIIQLVAVKEAYIQRTIGISRDQFLKKNYKMLWQSISRGGS